MTHSVEAETRIQICDMTGEQRVGTLGDAGALAETQLERLTAAGAGPQPGICAPNRRARSSKPRQAGCRPGRLIHMFR